MKVEKFLIHVCNIYQSLYKLNLAMHPIRKMIMFLHANFVCKNFWTLLIIFKFALLHNLGSRSVPVNEILNRVWGLVSEFFEGHHWICVAMKIYHHLDSSEFIDVEHDGLFSYLMIYMFYNSCTWTKIKEIKRFLCTFEAFKIALDSRNLFFNSVALVKMKVG